MIGAEDAGAGLLLLLLIIIACVAAVVHFIRIPYTVALVVAGLALALLPNTPQLTVTPEVILFLFLPILLFYGAYHLNVRDLRVTLKPVTLLALPGVVATAGLVGLALHVAAGLSWTSALLFGTIVAATDPVAVLSIFGEMGAPRRLSTIVTGESLFNDGTALVFYGAVLGVATSSTLDAGATVERFVIAVLGGLALGVAVGVVGTAIVKNIDNALLETVITLIMAYGGFLLADRLGASGPLETVAAGIFLGVTSKSAMSATTRLQSSATWEFLDFLANSLLFLIMGLSVRRLSEETLTRLGTGLLWPLGIAIVAVVLSRVLVVWGVGGLLKVTMDGFLRRWNVVLVWAGLRGAVALAAALSLPLGLPDRDLLLTMTLGIVLFTLLVQGLTMRPLLTWLGVVRTDTSRREIDLAVGRLQVTQAAAREVGALQETGALDPAVAKRLIAGYAARREEIRQSLTVAYGGSATWERREERAAARHLLQVQREAARSAAAQGQIAEDTLGVLLKEIDQDLARVEQEIQADGEG
ncbi:MAG TPA: Na+/H+ antiporter [Ktedonobacterales bacterium]|jgi:CPA1 family monovalent cation:H+ antiporter